MRHRFTITVCAITSLLLGLTTVPTANAATLANAASTVVQLSPVTYRAFDGHTEVLIPWQGNKITVLVRPGVTRDTTVMTKIVQHLDAAWLYYAKSTGRTPTPYNTLNRRSVIAEVNTACGAACSWLGLTGTEIQPYYFDLLYNAVSTSNQYDQVLFYELGRNFWFWSPALELKSPDTDPVVTGFAVWMRFRSMKAAKVQGAPFNGIPFATFQSQVARLVSQYEANTSLTFAETLALGRSPGAFGGTDFWASIMMQLANRHGGQTFVNRFWRFASSETSATTTAGSVTNWLRAANYASCVDLSSVFYNRWGFPHPDGSVSPRLSTSAVPEPVGHC